MNLFDMFRTIAIYDILNYQKLLSKKVEFNVSFETTYYSWSIFLKDR